MNRFRSFTTAAGVALAFAVTANFASAGDKPCIGCGSSGHGIFSGLGGNLGGAQPRTVFGGSHRSQLPAFQAAPWYNYWPYDAHFLTPAPVNGAFYGPPNTGNFPVNPYFPSAGYGPGYGFGAAGAPGMPVPQPMPVPPGR